MRLAYRLWKRISPLVHLKTAYTSFGSLELATRPTCLHYIFSWKTPSARKFPEPWVRAVGPSQREKVWFGRMEEVVNWLQASSIGNGRAVKAYSHYLS